MNDERRDSAGEIRSVPELKSGGTERPAAPSTPEGGWRMTAGGGRVQRSAAMNFIAVPLLAVTTQSLLSVVSTEPRPLTMIGSA